MSRSAHLSAIGKAQLSVTPFLIVNPRSGDGGADELVAAAGERGIETHVLGEDDDPAALARSADADALGMAGGDGSLGPRSREVAVERELPFVCIPFGTRNHFARDLGLDRDDPFAALDAFADGVERRVDVGRANDRLFLNNVSLGVYAQLVHRREHHRRRRDAFARLRALGTLATHRHDDGLTLDGAPLDTRIVLVSNNAYDLTLLSVGERERLDEGLLHLYAPHRRAAPAVGGSLGRAVHDRRAEAPVRAAIDGEPEVLDDADRVHDRAGRATRPRAARPRRLARGSARGTPSRAARPRANQRSSSTSSAATGSPSPRTIQVTEKTCRAGIRLDVDPHQLHRLDLEARLLAELAAQAVLGRLGLLQEPAGEIPAAAPRLVRTQRQQDAAVALEDRPARRGSSSPSRRAPHAEQRR